MSYCSIDDVKNIIPERELINLTNDNPTREDVIDVSRFEAVSKDTDSLIDGYLRARYKLPLKTIPSFITQIAQDICAYRLYLRRPREIPENIVKNYEHAISNLKEIKKGNLLLPDNTEDEESLISAPKSIFRINKRTSSRLFGENFIQSFR